jgi:NAD(P)-dependent dehydrogenase (short-subunit alcohol dehydrogenase family)
MFKDKIAIVTGASGGIGKEVTRQLSENGAKVTLVGTSKEKLDATVKELELAEGTYLTVPANVSNESEVMNYVDKTIEAFGRIDIFINNAGYESGATRIVDTPMEDFEKVFAINVFGVFNGMKYVLRHMEAQKSGVIINTASVAGFIGTPAMASYTASKHAVIGLTKSAALETAALGVRINAVAPSPVDNRMMRSLENSLSGGKGSEMKEIFAQSIPMLRYAQNSEIADMIIFLASDKAKFITGVTYRVDGGMAAK